MLYYFCLADRSLDQIARSGLDRRGAIVFADLETALRRCADRLLVADLEAPLPARVPPAAFLNLDPYRPPQPVAAGGGYVLRTGAGGLEVLLIYRRGAWDLPKGKQDPGESIEACAVREVQEEIGVDDIRIRAPLGQTTHAYLEQGKCLVKTSHWYWMETAADAFTPERSEGIEEVAWVPWHEAPARIDYETLRRHMLEIDPLVRSPDSERGGA